MIFYCPSVGMLSTRPLRSRLSALFFHGQERETLLRERQVQRLVVSLCCCRFPIGSLQITLSVSLYVWLYDRYHS